MLRRNLAVWQYSNGQQLTIPIFEFPGTQGGPSAYIQANIHGAEVQGNGVIYHLLRHFAKHTPRGRVVLVPFANPYAGSNRIGDYTVGRHDPASGDNWNRGYLDITCRTEAERLFPEQVCLKRFASEQASLPWPVIQKAFQDALLKALASLSPRSATQHITLPLQRLATEADVVLDLHTAPVATRYAYVPEYALGSAAALLMPHLLVIPNRFDGALDEAIFCPWWRLQEAFQALGRDLPLEVESFTLEHGSQEVLDLTAAEDDARGILNYLAAKNVIAGPSRRKASHCCRLEDYLTVNAEEGGLFDFRVQPGERVREGELLAARLNLHAVEKACDLDAAICEVRSPTTGVVLLRAPSAAAHSGSELFKLMTRVFEQAL